MISEKTQFDEEHDRSAQPHAQFHTDMSPGG
jgi:hypothetical protein